MNFDTKKLFHFAFSIVLCIITFIAGIFLADDLGSLFGVDKSKSSKVSNSDASELPPVPNVQQISQENVVQMNNGNEFSGTETTGDAQNLINEQNINQDGKEREGGGIVIKNGDDMVISIENNSTKSAVIIEERVSENATKEAERQKNAEITTNKIEKAETNKEEKVEKVEAVKEENVSNQIKTKKGIKNKKRSKKINKAAK